MMLNRLKMRPAHVAMVLMLGAWTAASAQAPSSTSGDEPEAGATSMTVWSVDSGGGESSHGGLTLVATAGQHDAGVVSEGGFALAGGLWAGEVDLGLIFSDGFENNSTGAWSTVVGSAP